MISYFHKDTNLMALILANLAFNFSEKSSLFNNELR